MSPGVPANLPALELARAQRNSGVERNRAGLAVSAREARGHHRIERQNHDDVARRAHLEDGGDCHAGRRKYRRAASLAGGIVRPTRASRWPRSAASSSRRFRNFVPRSACCSTSRRTISTATSRSKPTPRAKMRLFENQLDRDAAVLNADDPEITRRMPARGHVSGSAGRSAWPRARLCATRKLSSGRTARKPWSRDAVRSAARRTQRRKRSGRLRRVIPGWRAAPAAIAKGVKTFRGVEHRLEFVAEVGGVEFYNDSKATNVDATLKALDAFPGPLLVILGGKDKGSPYSPLARTAAPARAAGAADRRGCRTKSRPISAARSRSSAPAPWTAP